MMSDELNITDELINLWSQDLDLFVGTPYRRMASQANRVAREHVTAELARLQRIEAAALENGKIIASFLYYHKRGCPENQGRPCNCGLHKAREAIKILTDREWYQQETEST